VSLMLLTREPSWVPRRRSGRSQSPSKPGWLNAISLARGHTHGCDPSFRDWMRCPRSRDKLSASVQCLAGTREDVQRTSNRVHSTECDHYDADPRHGLAKPARFPFAAVSTRIEDHCPNEIPRIAAKVYDVSQAEIEPGGRVSLLRAAPSTHPRTR
jgi:hypothetical protein